MMPPDVEALFNGLTASEIWAKPTSDAARKVLQWLSVERMKDNPRYWIYPLAKRMNTTGKYAIAGCRMPAEVKWIQNSGGEVWWVDRKTNPNGYLNHITEQMTREQCDRIIDNSSTLDALRLQIEILVANSRFAVHE